MNDTASGQIFEKFIESLDRGRAYFTVADIEEFESYRYELDDFLKQNLRKRPCNKNIIVMSDLVAPNVIKTAISFSLFVTNMSNEETILNAAIATISIKIINMTLFSLLIAINSDS